MAQIGEYLENGVLQCKSVNHPPSMTTDTMYFLEEKNGFLAFGCRVCTELTKQPQLHILAVNKASKAIYQQTRKAEHIERNDQGKIVSFR
jgi:hypothetical protein